MKQTIDYRGFEIEIQKDVDPMNPREDWDHMGTFVYKHRNYNLGDKEIDDPIDWLLSMLDREDEKIEYDNETFMDLLSNFKNVYAALFVYMYEHSVLTISTFPFSCRWDSGMVGIIYVSLNDAISNWTLPKESTWETLIDDWGENKGKKVKLMDVAIRVLEGEIKTQNDYLTSNVWGYNIDSNGCNDSCWGYFGDVDYCISEAKLAVDHHIKQLRKKHFKQLKKWIKNRVPVQYRHALNY